MIPPPARLRTMCSLSLVFLVAASILIGACSSAGSSGPNSAQRPSNISSPPVSAAASSVTAAASVVSRIPPASVAAPTHAPIGGAETATAASGKSLPVTLGTYKYRLDVAGNGFSDATFSLYYVNTGDKPIPGFRIDADGVDVQTEEGKVYPGDFPSDGADFPGLDGHIPPGLPLPTDLQLGYEFASTTHPRKVVIHSRQYGDISFDVSNLSDSAVIPATVKATAEPLSNFTKLLSAETADYSLAVSDQCTISPASPGGRQSITFHTAS